MPLIAGSQDYIHGGTQKNEYKSEEVIDVPCPSCGSEAVERTPPRPIDGAPTPGRVGLICGACGRVVSYIDRGEISPALH